MDFQIGERKIKNCKQNYTIPHAESAFELVHTTVPNGEKNPRACSRYQPEGEKTLRLLQGRAHYMHRDKLISRRNGNSKQQEFRAAEREGGIPRRGRRNQGSSRDGSVEQTPFRGRKTPG